MQYLSPGPTLDNTVYEITYDQLRLMYRDNEREARGDVELIISFIRKNREIITMEKTSKEPRGPRMETRMSSHYKHQKKIDELKKVNEETSDEFVAKAQEACHEGQIDLAELLVLLKKNAQ